MRDCSSGDDRTILLPEAPELLVSCPRPTHRQRLPGSGSLRLGALCTRRANVAETRTLAIRFP